MSEPTRRRPFDLGLFLAINAAMRMSEDRHYQRRADAIERRALRWHIVDLQMILTDDVGVWSVCPIR